jgi:aspartyl protease family protein
VNGHPVTFIIDTGANLVAVPRNLLEQCKLVRGNSITILTANGKATAFKSVANVLAVGEIVLYDVPVLITPPSVFQFVLLGMSALRLMEVHIINGELTLTYNPTTGGA